MRRGFVAFFWSADGLEATKGPHSGVSAAHHAAGAAARALRDKTYADRRHERQRATSMRTYVRRCVPPRGRPTIGDWRWQAPPNVHTRMQATPPHHPNSQPARRRAKPWYDRRPPKTRAPASAEHPQRFGRQSLSMAGRSAVPTSVEHEELARAPAPLDKRRVISDMSRNKDRHSRRRNERRR